MKNWYKSKTIWTAIIAVITGVSLYFTGEQSLQDLLISVLGIVFGTLRVLTNEPIK